MVEGAAFEFAQTEEFLQAAEAITGCDYVWTRYDILCLPPSFPYGGVRGWVDGWMGWDEQAEAPSFSPCLLASQTKMENPCLTFATPTLLAGDRSLADVIAHEIAHSWSGNLVTNHTWEHFWLNEG